MIHPPHGTHYGTQFRVGWEWEVMLTPRYNVQRASTLTGFAHKLTDVHNKWVTSHAPYHTVMVNRVGHIGIPNPYQHWSVEADGSLRHQPSQSKYGVEIHVHVSLPNNFDLDALVHLSEAILHFEPAFEALLPEERGGHIFYARSNWLNNPSFYTHGTSRKDAINMVGRCKSKQEVCSMMSPRCRYYGWNFSNCCSRNATIEFRRGQSARERGGALKWMEVAASFVWASCHAGKVEHITCFPPTKGGLEKFLQAAHLPQGEGLFQERQLQGFFKGKDDDARKEPGILSEAPNSLIARYLPPQTERQTHLMNEMVRQDQNYGKDS
ncbi:MAG: hypothetical protein Q9162_006381 [Coniocarpon cinnabarinum]